MLWYYLLRLSELLSNLLHCNFNNIQIYHWSCFAKKGVAQPILKSSVNLHQPSTTIVHLHSPMLESISLFLLLDPFRSMNMIFETCFEIFKIIFCLMYNKF